MSYFTEMLDETMDLLETKSQTRASYERDISYSRQSNEWHRNNPNPGKGVKRDFTPHYSGKPGSSKYKKAESEADKAIQPMRTAEDYRRREKLYGKNADDLDKDDKSTAKYRNFVSKHPTAQKLARMAAKHESYDPVLDDLISMGVID